MATGNFCTYASFRAANGNRGRLILQYAGNMPASLQQSETAPIMPTFSGSDFAAGAGRSALGAQEAWFTEHNG